MTIFVERYTEIERENRILLEKMTNIMQEKDRAASNPPQTSLSHKLAPIPGKSVLDTSVHTTLHTHTQSVLPPIQKKSLNQEARRRELQKITNENKKLL